MSVPAEIGSHIADRAVPPELPTSVLMEISSLSLERLDLQTVDECAGGDRQPASLEWLSLSGNG